MLKNKKTVISMASALCAFALVGGVSAINANAAEATLEGFSCAGVSVNAEEVGVRFEFNLIGDATAKKDLEAGVVYMPYDLYTGDTADFTKDTVNAQTTAFGWEENEETATEGDYVGYSYLAASAIPETMYNRVLLVRGYIVDGETVYYTQAKKASMADSAWKGIAALPEYEETLKAYMGPYTLTSEAGNVENLYYGDTVTGLPTSNNGKNIAKWYWDEAKTNEIAATDYATGSMTVYPKYESFVVSGVVSGADNLETVKVQINGADTNIAVAANGEYSVELEIGTYDFRFYNDSYVAYATDVAVSAATEVNATLVSNKWDAGTFGDTSEEYSYITGSPEEFDTIDMLDGSFATPAVKSGVVFPNTATTNAFQYTATISHSDSARDDWGACATISTNKQHISVGMYRWGRTAVINVSDGYTVGPAFSGCYTVSAFSDQNNTYTVKFVRTGTEIECYINNVLVFTFTKDALVLADGVTNKWTNDAATNWGRTSTFYAENANICAGILANVGNGKSAANYSELSMNEFATVSGKVSLPEGSTLDLTATTLTVGGVAYDMTIDAEGNFTAYIPEGTQTLNFKNGTWGATAADQVISLGETNTVNVTLADCTWVVGNYKNITSVTPSTFTTSATGVYTVSGGNFLALMPYTATTGNFEFTVDVSGIAYQGDESSIGLAISNGKTVISFNFWKWRTRVNIATRVGNGNQVDFTNAMVGNNTSRTLKMVRSQDAISVYLNDSLVTTLNATGHEGGTVSTNWTGGDGLLTTDGLSALAGFFGENVELCVGLASMTGGAGKCANATYTCSFTNK